MSFKVGVVDFDLPPGYRRGGSVPRKRSSLCALLAANGIDFVHPLGAERLGEGDGAGGPAGPAAGDDTPRSPTAVGVNTPQALAACADLFRREAVDCLLVDLFHWTRVPLVLDLVRELDLPTGLYANTRGPWNGVTAVTAASGSLREQPGLPRHARLAERFRDTEPEDLLAWLRGIAALRRLRRSRLLLWGGSYGADIPFTRGDPAALEGTLVREILTEQELVLVERARGILAGEPARVEAFRRWLADGGAAIHFDGKMLTREALDLQVALYLAARDRLRELGGESIAGVAVKCHFEVSTGPVGVTECLLPAFLPFGADAEGAQPVVPVACEGDLNGLVSSALLHALNPGVPPLFGDLVSYGADHVLLRNCGASSVWWAARGRRPEQALSGVELLPNMHGRSGAAVHYETPGGPGTPPVTFARLFRADGAWGLFAGEARVAAPAEGGAYPDPWPHTRLRFPSDPYLLFQAAPCNHGSLTEGSFTRELAVLARYAGLRLVRCDRDESLRAYLEGRT